MQMYGFGMACFGPSKMARFPLQKSTPARLTNKLSFSRRDFSSDRDHVWPPFNRHSFERVIVNVHRLRFDRDCTAIPWIIDDQVCVAAGLDGALPGKQPEDLRRLCARG